MRRKIIIVVIFIILLLLSIFCIKKISIIDIVSKYTYIGKEYCYTYDSDNKHQNKRYYYFYFADKDNTIFCIENNNRIIKINSIEELEELYITKVNSLIMDKSNAHVAYDENNNECSSMYLKNKMFPSAESNYWDFIKE